ncbi:MAG: sulfur carrier protein ThiS [Dokdonella sp.]
MKVALNGEDREIDPATSILQLLELAGYAQRRVAVEVNREIVPRSCHDSHPLNPGDRIEIVHAIGGG